MKEEDINKILQKMKIPEPDESTKKATIKAVMVEFHQQKLSHQKNLKGIEGERRLTGKLSTFLTFLGGFAMRKSFVISSGVTVVLAILVIGLLLPSLSRVRESALKSLDKRSIDEGLPINIGAGSKREDKPELPERYVLSTEQKQVEILTESEDSSSLLAMKDERLRVPSAKPKERKFVSPEAKKPSNKIVVSNDPSDKVSRFNEQVGRGSGIVSRLDKKLSIGAVSKQKLSDTYLGSGFDTSRSGTGEYGLYEYQDIGRDQFETITLNPVKLVSVEPVSTFSIDVDTASYTFIRRQLNHGVLPQKNAVRIEEMINYFNYDYSVPSDRVKPFQPTIAVHPTPWNPDTKLLHIGIKGYDIIPEKKPRSNLVFLIDVSGSMNAHDKLPLLKNSFRMLVKTLDEEDTVAIVVYAGAAGTVLETTKVKDKGKILAALDQLQAGGSTAGGEGIRRAYELAEANFDKDGLNRVILATDGDFNVGIRDPEELKSFVERKRKTGIFLSVLGYGQGNYNDTLMQKLAQNGNGNAAYIDNLNEARKVLVDEASSTLFTIAKDVKIQIEFNPEMVAEYRLIGYESRMLKREDFNNDKVDAGDIGSGHSVTALYEITPVGSKSKFVNDLRYDNKEEEKATGESFDNEYAFLKIRYKLPDSEQSQLINTPITPENEYTELEQVPTDIQFAASVAAFGQLLRGGIYTGEFSYDDVAQLAESVVGRDPFGYKHEFINLVRLVKSVK